MKEATQDLVTTGTPRHHGIPCTMFYSLFRALPGDRAFLPPSLCGSSPAKLDASVGASGPHDFAVREPSPLVCGATASIASRLAFVTTRTPLVSRRDGAEKIMISEKTKEKYFSRRGWTRTLQSSLVGQISADNYCFSPASGLRDRHACRVHSERDLTAATSLRVSRPRDVIRKSNPCGRILR